MSCHVMSCHVLSCCVASRRVASCPVMPRRVMLRRGHHLGSCSSPSHHSRLWLAQFCPPATACFSSTYPCFPLELRGFIRSYYCSICLFLYICRIRGDDGGGTGFGPHGLPTGKSCRGLSSCFQVFLFGNALAIASWPEIFQVSRFRLSFAPMAETFAFNADIQQLMSAWPQILKSHHSLSC